MTAEIDLPRSESAELNPAKLRDYALSVDHPTGTHKARVFRSALDIGEDDWEYLRDQILDRLPESRVVAIRAGSPWGLEYEVQIMIDGLNGETHPVTTAWLVEDDTTNPRLITLYVDTTL